MYQFVICVLYFTIIGLFAVCWFALREWKSGIHTYLLFSSIANLVYNTGYLLQLQARTQETYVIAVKMGYLGRVWIGLALFLFIVELCETKFPSFLRNVFAVTHIIIYGTILNLESNTLYYNYMEFVMDGDFPKLIHTGGPLYYVQTFLNLFYTVGGIYLITRAFWREKNSTTKKCYFVMSIAIYFVGVTYVIYFFKLVSLARKFDVMIIGFAICTVLMLIAIIKYRMLDPRDAAKNYVVDELAEEIILADAEGSITYYNKPAQRMFSEIGSKDNEEDCAKELLDIFRDAIADNKPVRLGGKIYTPKANRLTDNGTTVGTLYTLSDDSEHYHYMEELREQKKIADEANAAKSMFLANMSHEIRTPINAVLGFNELIIRECSEAKDRISISANSDPASEASKSFSNISTYAGNIQNAGGNLLSIINDILDISKIEAGKMDIIEAAYTLSSLLNDVSNLVFFKAKEKNLKFNAEVDETIPDELWGDKARVRQVITNVLTNAVKYTDSGSVIMKVSGSYAGKKEPGQIIQLKIEVTDSGIGMHPEDLDKLFTKFQRLDLSHNGTIEGTGLGLAISHQIITMMNGSISVESEYGKGSVFRIEVPQKIVSCEPVGDFKAQFEKDILVTKTYKESFMAPDAHILVVDDTRVNLKVAQGLLKKTQVRIDTAGSGNEAITLAKDNEYDLILMDQRMPEMDGTEALKIIREQEGGCNKETPVICLTADAIIGARERYMAEGFTDYLAKPINIHELEQTLIKYLPSDKIISV